MCGSTTRASLARGLTSMPEIPPQAVQAAADVISRLLFSGQPEYGTWMEHDEDLARAAVEAAAPLIAEHIASLLTAKAATVLRSARNTASAGADEAAARFSRRSQTFVDAARVARFAFPADAEPATTPRTAPQPTETPQRADPRVVGSTDVRNAPEGPTALRERIADRLLAYDAEWGHSTFHDSRDIALIFAAVVLAVRDDELAALRVEVQQMTLARNGANAMRGVHKRQADRLRTELDHAKAALAGDNEAVRAFMADHEAKVQRLREQVSLWQHEAEQHEAAIERVHALASEWATYAPADVRGLITADVATADAGRSILAALDQPATKEQTGDGNG
ncbi:MAG: hypothetical protein JWO11_4316 [Nocardioides sp.]|nr:hypothetical protein [Nocardioides sp.]